MRGFGVGSGGLGDGGDGHRTRYGAKKGERRQN